MGLLTKQMNKEWIIEIREKFYCENETQAERLQKHLLKMKAEFTVKTEVINEQEYITYDVKNETIRPKSFEDCKIIYNNLLELKRDYAQKPTTNDEGETKQE